MEMSLSAYLPFILLHVAGGCILVNLGHELKITANVSDAVLLPCYCTDLNTTDQRFRWRPINKPKNMWDDLNGKRGQLVNAGSPGNLSLLISNLTVYDAGLYRCEINARNYTDIRLIVKGSLEIIPEDELTITAHAGGSVLLPCNFTDLDKAKKFKWRKYSMSKKKWDDLSSERNLLQRASAHSSGNRSLLISHLSKEDEGLYRCDLGRDKYRDIKLIVEGTPGRLPFVPFAVGSVIFLHIIVAVVYCTNKKKDSSRVRYCIDDGEGNVTLE